MINQKLIISLIFVATSVKDLHSINLSTADTGSSIGETIDLSKPVSRASLSASDIFNNDTAKKFPFRSLYCKEPRGGGAVLE